MVVRRPLQPLHSTDVEAISTERLPLLRPLPQRLVVVDDWKGLAAVISVRVDYFDQNNLIKPDGNNLIKRALYNKVNPKVIIYCNSHSVHAVAATRHRIVAGGEQPVDANNLVAVVVDRILVGNYVVVVAAAERPAGQIGNEGYRNRC